MKRSKTYSLAERLKILLWSSRPVSWINTAFPFVAGYLFVTGTTLSAEFWVATLYFLIPYNMLIYVINDVYDYESDMRNPRKGGVEGAILPKALHPFMLRATVAINIPFVAFLLLTGGFSRNVLFVLCVLDALAYSMPPARLKERPVLDSISSSFHFVSPLLFALVWLGWSSSYALYAVAFFAWGMASHAFGAVQDILPDRAAGLRSIATHLGAKGTVRFSYLLYVCACALVILRGWPSLLVGLVGVIYLLILAPYLHITDEQSATTNRGWKYFMQANQLLGFCVTILLILKLTSK